MADVDLDLTRAKFGRDLLDVDMHRLERVADAVEEVRGSLETVEGKHAARICRGYFPSASRRKR